MHGFGHGPPIWILLIMLVYLLLLAGIGIYLIRYFLKGSKNQKSALDILNEQLAKGEISEDDYDRLKRKITDKDGENHEK
ncbi:SHOCT domain-containing protein [Salisediminibacterium halotolerans]|uniref:Membrane protein n=1 Tax=Salisediminibacterium halotolerans TaxID=517425 RepID=A0A1H9W024_9BACI|nr:SHOCT domain-containing protein [Salisediminibacterium haloalkalitolerans]SES26997.1 putative membrane protein [Salisediminibacterium haloalkalitolerans]